MSNPKMQSISVGGEGIPEKTGAVKWFNRLKGYGIINPDDGSREVFVLYAHIGVESNLYVGDLVAYDLMDNGKGPEAFNVRRR